MTSPPAQSASMYLKLIEEARLLENIPLEQSADGPSREGDQLILRGLAVDVTLFI
jgi:hypothetical protein